MNREDTSGGGIDREIRKLVKIFQFRFPNLKPFSVGVE